MRRLGLIGGVSPESTAIYYRLLNNEARRRLGGQHSADVMIAALDYGVMIRLYDAADWEGFSGEVAAAATRLAAGGAEALIICSNTTHLAADRAAQESGLPVLHMLDALAAAMRHKAVSRPLLLGTPVVMAGPFYRRHLAERYDGDIVTPTEAEQAETARIILDELVEGVVREESRAALVAAIDRARRDDGVDGVILGCTELCMILDQTSSDLPVFDTTSIHASAAAAFAFGDA